MYIFLFLCCVPLSAFKAFSCFFCFWTLFVLKGFCCFSNGSKRFHIISNMSKWIQMGPKNPTTLHPGYTEATSRLHSGFIQATFRLHQGYIQATSRLHPAHMYVASRDGQGGVFSSGAGREWKSTEWAEKERISTDFFLDRYIICLSHQSSACIIKLHE